MFQQHLFQDVNYIRSYDHGSYVSGEWATLDWPHSRVRRETFKGILVDLPGISRTLSIFPGHFTVNFQDILVYFQEMFKIF